MPRKLSETFDEVAELYDRSRPGYPAALVEAVIATAQLGNTAKILEVGTGTGKATLPFAERGYTMRCLEPGHNLAAVAAANLRTYPNVAIEAVTFEDWPLQPRAFDLVMSAQAFHWIDPEVRYLKSAQALNDSGWIALFWNISPDQETPLAQELEDAYRVHAPMIAKGSDHQPFIAQVQAEAGKIEQSGYFRSLSVMQFPWTRRYSTQQYLDLLNTYSNHRTLPQTNQRALFNAIAAVINEHGGSIEKSDVAVLYLAQKRNKHA